ncbi:MAG: glycosyltransferase [Bacteroidota bacterium]|nr:glycosyltransferase [Bacteroidota bacterium]
MISIITGIYNQRAMNEIFYETLKRNTKNPFELIVVDNQSTDGSTDYFAEKEHVVLLRNDGNYNYPYCQNAGLKKAKYDLVCFFNNDILVAPDWDKRMLDIFSKNKSLQMLSVASNDHLESKPVQQKLARKWKRIKHPLQFILGNSKTSLNIMKKFMYGDFNTFAEKRFQKWGYKLIEGYSGSALMTRKTFIDDLGGWDKRIQAADYDLFNRVKKRSLSDKNVMPVQLALGIYFHHYQKLTLKKKYPPFKNKSTMIRLADKWGEETATLRKDIVG